MSLVLNSIDVLPGDLSHARHPLGNENVERGPGLGDHSRIWCGAGERHKDVDALAMAAESFMNLNPWDYYVTVWILSALA